MDEKVVVLNRMQADLQAVSPGLADIVEYKDGVAFFKQVRQERAAFHTRDRRGLCRTCHKMAEEGLLFEGSCLCRSHDHVRRQKDNRDKEEHQGT